MYGILISALVAFLLGGYGATVWQQNKYEALIGQLQAQYAEATKQAIEEAQKETQRRKDEVVRLEIQNSKNTNTLNDLQRELSTYRLQDPGGQERMPRDSTASESACQASRAYLSKELDRFLKAEALRADQAAAYAQLCHSWIKSLLP